MDYILWDAAVSRRRRRPWLLGSAGGGVGSLVGSQWAIYSCLLALQLVAQFKCKLWLRRVLSDVNNEAGVSFVDCEGGYHEKRLLHDLLDPYNILERPVVNESDPLQLSFGLTLMQIIDVVRKEQNGDIYCCCCCWAGTIMGWFVVAGEYNKRMTVNGFVCADKLMVGNPLFHFHFHPNNPEEELRSYVTLPSSGGSSTLSPRLSLGQELSRAPISSGPASIQWEIQSRRN